MNNRGVVVGTSTKYVAGKPKGDRAVRWAAGSSIPTELGALSVSTEGFSSTSAAAISDDGTTVGNAQQTSENGGVLRAVRWDATTNVPSPLDQVFMNSNSGGFQVVTGINAAHTTIGLGLSEPMSAGGFSGQYAIRWDKKTSAGAVLGSLDVRHVIAAPNFEYDVIANEAMAINDVGTTVGYSVRFASGNSGQRAVRWAKDSTVPIELPGLGFNSSGESYSQAYANNNSDTVVGSATRYVNGVAAGTRAVRWDDQDVVTELGNLGPGTLFSNSNYTALAVNGYGAAVGYYAINGQDNQPISRSAIYWKPDGTAVNLNDFLGTTSSFLSLNYACSIDGYGWISGVGYDSGSSGLPYERAFLMLIPSLGSYGKGDANFDTVVNFDDLIILAQNYNKPNAALATTVADLDLNGQTSFDDLIVLAQHYNTSPANVSSLGSAFAADWALAQSLVPEPTALACAALSVVALRRRRLS